MSDEKRMIVLLPYDERWTAEFLRISDFVAPALKGLALSIEHAGSTSVPGLWAKPILDIDVVIPSIEDLPEAIKRLSEIGYHYRGNLGIEAREAFAYLGDRDFMTQRFYVCPSDSAELRRHIALRDYLRADQDARDAYSRIKREGARLFPHGIGAYIAHKGPFIRGVYGKCELSE